MESCRNADEAACVTGNIDSLGKPKKLLLIKSISWNDYKQPCWKSWTSKPAILGTLSVSTDTLDEINRQIEKNSALSKLNKSRTESAINTAISYIKSIDGLTYSHDNNTKPIIDKDTKVRIENLKQFLIIIWKTIECRLITMGRKERLKKIAAFERDTNLIKAEEIGH